MPLALTHVGTADDRVYSLYHRHLHLSLKMGQIEKSFFAILEIRQGGGGRRCQTDVDNDGQRGVGRRADHIRAQSFVTRPLIGV